MADKQRFETKSTENISFRQIYTMLLSVKSAVDELNALLRKNISEKEADKK